MQLVAQSSWLKDYLSKKTNIQGVNLFFSSRRGHIFLQTDQPVYNPGQRGAFQPRGPHFAALPSPLSDGTHSPGKYPTGRLLPKYLFSSPTLPGRGPRARAHPLLALGLWLTSSPSISSSVPGLCSGSEDAPDGRNPHGHGGGESLTSDLPDRPGLPIGSPTLTASIPIAELSWPPRAEEGGVCPLVHLPG